jgi:CIC family chloride channel protein
MAIKTHLNSALTNSQPAQFRIVLVSFLAAGIGLVAGLVAYALHKLIGLFTNLFFFQRWSTEFTSVRFHHLGPWVILVPVIGGLVVGVMAKYGSPKIKGHGIPEAMEAVLTNRSRIEPKVALLKPISAAIAIGTGGPFGAEGPIIQTGGAIGSLVGQVLHTTAVERKVLLAGGAAAGRRTFLRARLRWWRWGRCSGRLRGRHFHSSFSRSRLRETTTQCCR